MPLRYFVVATFVAGLLGSSFAVAQEPVHSLDPLADLRGRIEALERENQQLKASVSRLPKMQVEAPSNSDYVSLPQVGTGIDDARIRSAVAEFLQEHGQEFTSAASNADALAPSGDPGVEVGKDLTMSARWNNGLEVATKDKAFRIHVGGRWQMDTSWLNPESNITAGTLPAGVDYHDGVDFRRARLRIDGTMYENVEFAMEYDFVNGLRSRNFDNSNFQDANITAITDLWLQFSRTPLGHLRIGNHKEAIGFEHIVSSRFLPFMERSYNQDTFYGGSFNGFSPGASLTKNIWEDRASWNIGVYKPTNNVFGFNVDDGDYAVTGRLTYLPIYENEGRQLLHLGVSGRQATTYDDRIRFRTRDAMRAGVSTQWPVPADISVFGDTMQWLNFELAAINGPWTFQAEWLLSNTTNARRIASGAPVGPFVDNLFYQGGYIQLLYFLTGESDTYSLERMAFDRMKPFENAFWMQGADGCNVFGRGAWQIGARYNFLDLNDQGINGGQLHNLTVGLNWFWNPNTKWQFNYIATYRDASDNSVVSQQPGTGWINGWGMRFAQDF